VSGAESNVPPSTEYFLFAPCWVCSLLPLSKPPHLVGSLSARLAHPRVLRDPPSLPSRGRLALSSDSRHRALVQKNFLAPVLRRGPSSEDMLFSFPLLRGGMQVDLFHFLFYGFEFFPLLILRPLQFEGALRRSTLSFSHHDISAGLARIVSVPVSSFPSLSHPPPRLFATSGVIEVPLVRNRRFRHSTHGFSFFDFFLKMALFTTPLLESPFPILFFC